MSKNNLLKNPKYLYCVGALAVILLCALDQLTKYLVATNMQINDTIPLIDGVFRLRYIINEGAAWSILEGKQIIFIIITPIIVFFLGKIFICLPKEKKYNVIRILDIFLISGAVGNLIDRIFQGETLFKGGVVDFFDFYLINFPVFNVADIYVSVSVTILMILMLFYYKDEEFEVICDCCVKFKKEIY